MKYTIRILVLIIISTLFVKCNKDNDNNTQPNKPIATLGASYICEEIRPTLSWNCLDIDKDELTYSLRFGSSPTALETISSNLASTEYTFTYNLEVSTTYYWQIVASDGKDETISDVWEFTTIDDPIINKVPSTPIIVSPKIDTQAGNIEFIWSAVVDDGGSENITYILNINGETYEITESTSKIITVSKGACNWLVTAYDSEGNGSESENVSINIFE